MPTSIAIDGVYGTIKDTATASTKYTTTTADKVTIETIEVGMDMDAAYEAGWTDADLLQVLNCFETGTIGKVDCYLFNYHVT